jgi:hypothetical protein
MSAASSSAGGTINNCIPPASSSSCTGPDYPGQGQCTEWPPSMNPGDSFYPYPGMPPQGPQPPTPSPTKTLK